MAENDAKITIGADATQLEASLRTAQETVRNSMEQMGKHVEGLSKSFEKVKGAFVAFAAIVAGGKVFKEAISQTVEMAKESQKLARTLGISATEASVLAVALDDIYQSGDQVTTAAAKITKTLNTNEDAFKDLGVATRDVNGHFRNSFDIMQDVNKRLGEFKEGTDRNVEAQKIYGKSFQDMLPLIKLTGEKMEESRKKAESLGLTLGVEGAEKVAIYRASMNDLHDVFQGVSKAVGEALMPVLSELADAFSEYGPAAVKVMKYAMAGLVTAFYGLKEVVQIVWQTVKAGVQQVVVILLTLAEVGSRALKFDFAGAKAAWQRGGEQMRDIGKTWGANLVKDAEANRDKIFKAWSDASNPQTAIKGNKSGATSEGGAGGEDKKKEKADNLFIRLEQELAAEKAALTLRANAEGRFREMSSAEERAWWQSKLALASGNAKAQGEIGKKLSMMEIAAIKDKYVAMAAAYQDEEAAAGADYAAKEAIVLKQMALYQNDSKEFSALQKHLTEVAQQHVAQLERLDRARVESKRNADQAVLAADLETARFQKELGLQTSAQLIQAEVNFEGESYRIKLKALQDELELQRLNPARNVEQIQKLDEEILSLKRLHDAQMTQLARKAALDQQKPYMTAINAIESSFASSFGRLMQGQIKFGAFIKSLWQGIVSSITGMLAQMAAKWIATQLQQLIFGKAKAASEVGTAAAVAGANGVASWAMAPWPVNIGAPAFGLAMAGAAAAFSAGVAAEGGFDVPGGVNPITQLHQREMVLPAHIADPLRENIASGEMGGGGGVTVNINATDAQSVQRLFANNGHHLAAALKQQLRNSNTGRVK